MSDTPHSVSEALRLAEQAHEREHHPEPESDPEDVELVNAEEERMLEQIRASLAANGFQFAEGVVTPCVCGSQEKPLVDLRANIAGRAYLCTRCVSRVMRLFELVPSAEHEQALLTSRTAIERAERLSHELDTSQRDLYETRERLALVEIALRTQQSESDGAGQLLDKLRAANAAAQQSESECDKAERRALELEQTVARLENDLLHLRASHAACEPAAREMAEEIRALRAGEPTKADIAARIAAVTEEALGG